MGLAGTGLSYTEKLSGPAPAPGQQPASVPGWIVALVVGVMLLGVWLAMR